MNPTRICFIGCGDHANRFIYPSLANVAEAELTAVCSREHIRDRHHLQSAI